jgi:hypothetical protein
MAMAADPRAGMRLASMHRYDEVTVAQVCHAALRELRFRTGTRDQGSSWEDLDPAERESMTEAVTVARTLIRLPGSRHAAPQDPVPEDPAREQHTADELLQLITMALTPF